MGDATFICGTLTNNDGSSFRPEYWEKELVSLLILVGGSPEKAPGKFSCQGSGVVEED